MVNIDSNCILQLSQTVGKCSMRMRKVKVNVKSSHASEQSLEGGGPKKRGVPAANECHFTAIHLHVHGSVCACTLFMLCIRPPQVKATNSTIAFTACDSLTHLMSSCGCAQMHKQTVPAEAWAAMGVVIASEKPPRLSTRPGCKASSPDQTRPLARLLTLAMSVLRSAETCSEKAAYESWEQVSFCQITLGPDHKRQQRCSQACAASLATHSGRSRSR